MPADSHAGEEIDRLQWGKLADWAQLVRLPTAFTLISNSLTAAIIVGSGWLPVSALLPTLVASIFAYWAGMILNDVVDIEEDRIHRPSRPLVRGRISSVVAGHVATGMLLIGPIIILAVCTTHPSNQLWLGAAFMASVSLSCCVRLYNSPVKSTVLGPVVMGACRAANILMVGSVMLAVNTVEENVLDLPGPLLMLATGIGIYIVGVTVYAFKEEQESSPALLLFGLLLEIIGLVCLACLPRWAGEGNLPAGMLDSVRGFPLLVGLIGVTVVRRGFGGVSHPVSRKVQLAVKHALLTLILLDAAIVLLWAGVWYAILIIVLLAPALISAARVRST